MGVNWTVLTTAPDQMTAEMWADLIRAQMIPCRLHPGDFSGFLGVSPHSVRLMVPEADLEKAREYLDDITGDGLDAET